MFSPHKFSGSSRERNTRGPRNEVSYVETPTLSGRVTVKFVTFWWHINSEVLATLGEGGTLYAIDGIRVEFPKMLKETFGQSLLATRQADLRLCVLATSGMNDGFALLCNLDAEVLAIISLRFQYYQGHIVNNRLFTRLLSDRYVNQAHDGCVCSGPYGYRPRGLRRAEAEATFAALARSKEIANLGWFRSDLPAFLAVGKANIIDEPVGTRARNALDCAVKCQIEKGTVRLSAFSAPWNALAP
ncbi:hypothetical protein [Roseobacter sp.]|uniref:hypothetical protein n=1 Tax=Roseobacter sp. TaxID=1907202 RepID=UPI00385BE0AF